MTNGRFLGTYTMQACRRIIAVYNTRDECHRVLIARPVECEIPAYHAYSCQIHFAKSGRVFIRQIQAVDAYAAARDCLRRFGSRHRRSRRLAVRRRSRRRCAARPAGRPRRQDVENEEDRVLIRARGRQGSGGRGVLGSGRQIP